MARAGHDPRAGAASLAQYADLSGARGWLGCAAAQHASSGRRLLLRGDWPDSEPGDLMNTLRSTRYRVAPARARLARRQASPLVAVGAGAPGDGLREGNR